MRLFDYLLRDDKLLSNDKAWHAAMKKEHPDWYKKHYTNEGKPHIDPLVWLNRHSSHH